MLKNLRKRKQKGFALIYVTLIGVFVLIPMGGLAIDFGMLYNIKARLQTAVDAAAIGAGYTLHASTDITDPTTVANIQATAQRYFNANYPGNYFGSSVISTDYQVSGGTSGRSITVTARAGVPMLLMRVLGINNSQVAAQAISNIKYVAMMIVVDRSGSVVLESADATIKSALTTFVATAATSYLVDSVDTVGMISFGHSWNLDFTPAKTFQSGTPNIGTAISNIPFDGNSGTNTGEGLFQGWTQLHMMNLPGSLNVIVLITDGRPSSFTAGFTKAAGSSCSTTSTMYGVASTYVSLGSYPFWPPPTSATDSFGIFSSTYQGKPESQYFVSNGNNCKFETSGSPTYNSMNQDFNSTWPSQIGPVDRLANNTAYTGAQGAGIAIGTGGYYSLPDTSMTDPKTGRYIAFNYADQIAKLIRQDTTLSPMMFVIGLNYAATNTEPLDEDFLARLANDPDYTTVGSDTSHVAAGLSVYQTNQTPGMYCNSTQATLSQCFSQISSELLRLIL